MALPMTITRTTNGNQRYKPSAKFSIYLIDVVNEDMVWNTGVKAEGHDKAKYGYLAEKAFRSGARKALKSGWLEPAAAAE